MAITGTAEGEPTKGGIAVSDLLAGCYLTVGILGALVSRAHTGRAARRDRPLLRDARLAHQRRATVLMTGERRSGSGTHPQIVPYRTFEASDGAFVLGVGTDRQFERLADLSAARTDRGRALPHQWCARRASRGPRGELAAISGGPREAGRAPPRRRHPGRFGPRAARGPALGDGRRAACGAAERASSSSRRRSGSRARAAPGVPPALDQDGERIRRSSTFRCPTRVERSAVRAVAAC
jgi:hypothetical protein